MSNGDTLSLASSSWSNSGTIAVTGGTLGLQGNGLTLAQLGTVTHTGGVVNLQTTLNDTGATLNVGTGTALGTLTLTTSGTIENGTIVDQGSGIAFSGGTLSGVTYDGTMSLSTTSSYVYLTNGLTLAGITGSGTGTINLTGQSADIYAAGGETLNNATLNIGNGTNYDYLYNYDSCRHRRSDAGLEPDGQPRRHLRDTEHLQQRADGERDRQCGHDQCRPERRQLHHPGQRQLHQPGHHHGVERGYGQHKRDYVLELWRADREWRQY